MTKIPTGIKMDALKSLRKPKLETKYEPKADVDYREHVQSNRKYVF